MVLCLNLNRYRGASLRIRINLSRGAKAGSATERFMLGLIRPHLMARFEPLAMRINTPNGVWHHPGSPLQSTDLP